MAETNIICERVLELDLRSANLPPIKYPILKLPNITPIRVVQTIVDVPTYGANTLEPTISRIIRHVPQRKTTISKEYFFIKTF